MSEEKTILKITVDNENKIHTYMDLSGIEFEEEALRILHSIIDEQRETVLGQINEIKNITEEDEEF